MKQLRKIFLVSAFISAAGLTGCAGLQTASSPEPHTLKTDVRPPLQSRSQYYEEMALGYAQGGNSERAVEFFRLALLHDPHNVTARVALAEEYAKTGRRHLAAHEFDQALEQQPGDVDILKRLADLYVSSRIYSKAEEVYQHLLSLYPQYDEARWALSALAEAGGRWAPALEQVESIRITEENAYRVAHAKARIYRGLGQADLSAQELRKAYTLNPRDRAVATDYAAWASDSGDAATAATALQGYSETHPYDGAISRALAKAAMQAGRYETALAEYKKQEAADYENLQLPKARAYYLMGDRTRAGELYTAVWDDSRDAEAGYYLAQLRLAAGEKDAAADLLEQIPAGSDHFGEARAFLAGRLREQGNAEEAQALLRDAYNRRPDQIEIYRAYTDLLIDRKYLREALPVIQNGLAEFPADEDLRLRAAFCHYRLGNYAEFSRYIRDVQKINPKNADMYAVLAMLWFTDGTQGGRKKDGAKIDDTEFLARKAMELKSTDRNLKPILAWMLLHKQKTAEAVALFEEAYETYPDEAFFARSLAEVYEMAGITGKAGEFSRRAVALEMERDLKSGPRNPAVVPGAVSPRRMPAGTGE